MRVTPSAVIVNPTVDNMTAGFTSKAITLNHIFMYAIQANWTGTAPIAGTFKIQASLDGKNWSDLSGASQSISGNPGTFLIEVKQVCHNFMRVIYTPSSGQGFMTVLATLKGQQP